ncbi:hypothetical protein Mal4_35420 [Maioricimonas rarisocia]|uniref:GIY-YIG domain-containing protein n=1 Tax=Maioricimonas rarisocia TaxID=2528026 RepID=A0A517Z9P4_9PLAN|nr:GIY-YIG nuclease family protein [Maioricimonas rarisocia]QDU39205.1 hypothetical protein Mal4_35420 [Maioricimonas rarisocia]
MLNLVELIRLAGIELGSYKIHCATDNKLSEWRPLEQYYAGTFEWGQARQSQKNFECENVVSIINLGDGKRWLFVGVYRVGGVRYDDRKGYYVYSLDRRSGLEHLEGRVIVRFPKSFRASYLVGANHEDQLVVDAIREEKMSIADFPGFNSVRLSFEMLKAVFRHDHPSWRAALANVSGVYVVADRTTGELYVGSAYGGVGIWQRWSSYAQTGHGGNKELRAMLKEHGSDYAHNFQFSLLEMCDINASTDYIISRESHWKEVLLTRDFGLNWN